MTVYVLKNGQNLSQIIDVCDNEADAHVLEDNLIKTGQYKSVNVEKWDVSTNPISPLDIVKIKGTYNNGSVKLQVLAHSVSSPVSDELKFNVVGSTITFDGVVNLTASEIADTSIDDLRLRIVDWVIDEFKLRLEDNNPV